MFAELLKSDEGLFHQYILPLIPFDLVKKLYSDKNNVRPAEYAINYVAAALFVRLTGLTEEEFLEQLPWNLKYQYAIGIEQWSDGIPFGEKTFTNLRKRIECYNGSHNNEDIWDEITHSIDVAIAKKMQLFKGYNDTYRYGLRIDTLMISMQAARRPRLDIVYTTMKLAVEELIAKEIILPDKLKHFTDKKLSGTTLFSYAKPLLQSFPSSLQPLRAWTEENPGIFSFFVFLNGIYPVFPCI